MSACHWSSLYAVTLFITLPPYLLFPAFWSRCVGVGLVMNPSVPHLACSPDRLVYDTTEEDPWGLLEIKSSMAELNYPKLHEQNGKYSLKKSHAYHYQVMDAWD